MHLRGYQPLFRHPNQNDYFLYTKLCLMTLLLHFCPSISVSCFCYLFPLSFVLSAFKSYKLVPISYPISASGYYSSSINGVRCSPLLNANLAGICLELSKSFDYAASLLTVNRLHLLDVNQQLCIEAAMYADVLLWRLKNSLSLEVRLTLPSDHVNGRVKTVKSRQL